MGPEPIRRILCSSLLRGIRRANCRPKPERVTSRNALRCRRAPLSVEPNLTNPLHSREDVVSGLTAHTDELGADDARHEIARQIENFLRCRTVEPFAQD